MLASPENSYQNEFTQPGVLSAAPPFGRAESWEGGGHRAVLDVEARHGLHARLLILPPALGGPAEVCTAPAASSILNLLCPLRASHSDPGQCCVMCIHASVLSLLLQNKLEAPHAILTSMLLGHDGFSLAMLHDSDQLIEA